MREGSGQGLCDVDCLGRSGKQFHASRAVHGTPMSPQVRMVFAVQEHACRRSLADCAAVRLCVPRGPQTDVSLHSGLAAGGAGFQTIRTIWRQATLAASLLMS